MGILVVGVVWLYWKVLVLEFSYITTDQYAITASSSKNLSTTISSFITDTTERVQSSIASSTVDLETLERVDSVFSHSLATSLSYELRETDAVFSLLPPGRYLRIPRLGIETPVVVVPYATPDKIEQWDFDEELKEWIVKYPFTVKPWEVWNTLLFGHSSVDSFEQSDNPFGFVFYNLPKLVIWDKIEVVRDGTVYEYEMTERHIKRPSHVPDLLNKEYEEHQLTLMACYPLLSDAKRILVTATLKTINWIPVS